MQGRLREAASTYQRVMDFASEHRAWPFPPTGAAYVGMGNLLREWNELETAGQHLHKGIELSKQGGYSGVMSQGYQYLARMKLAQGEVDEASTLLQTAEELVRRSGAHQQRSRVQALRVELWLVQGNLAAAVQWAADLEHNGEEKDFPPAYQRQLDRTIQVRVRLAQGEPDMAAIDTLLEKSGTGGWRRNEIELVMLKAVALDAQGDTGAAISSLAEALAMAEPEAYIRLFVDEGAAVAKLLRLAVLESISPTYVGRLQASFMPSMGEGLVSSQALIDPLTKRELKVLQLMANGLSNREIADELVIALGTVAKYSNNIFTKLNVRNRTQAISRARTLALI
jgi:LuxR family maltose regulon positive regulatory protein